MNSLKRIGALLMTVVLLCGALAMTSCKKDASGGSSTAASGGSSQKDKDKDKGKSASDGDKPAEGADEAQTGEELLSAFPPPPFADDLRSQCIYILNLDSNKEVWARNADERIDPASVTKVMTCILALELVPDLDKETATLTADINNFLYESRIDTLGGIAMGESLSIRDLLYAMMIQSANDAAMMVGKYVSTYDPKGRAPEDGDLMVFAEMMNEKAKEIGALNTHFTNASGLYDENQYSTAKDMALIAQYAWEHEEYGKTFQEIVSTNAYTSSPTNRMPQGITWYGTISPQQSSQANYYIQDLHGIKTGTLLEQNLHNYVSAVTRDGYTYLFSVCKAPVYDEEGGQYKMNLAFVDTKKLVEWVFETFQVTTLISVGELIADVNVRLAWDVEKVNLVAADKFASLVTVTTTADNVTKTAVFNNPKVKFKPGEKDKKVQVPYFDAPIEKGEELGYVSITTAGNLELGRVRLVAEKSVERSEWLYYMDVAKQFMGRFVFKFLLVLIIAIVVLYILLMIIRNHNRKRYRMRRKPPRPPAGGRRP